MNPAPVAEIYRGHDKHKSRPTQGVKGTRCPEWTHVANGVGVGTDMYAHDWALTRAQELLDTSVTLIVTRRRYTTGDGIAFEVKASGNGTFHGYPVSWNDVPAWLQRQWKGEGRVTQPQIRRYSDALDDFWAMDGDDAR